MPRRTDRSTPLVWLMPLGTIIQFMLPRWVMKRIAHVAGALVFRFNRAQRERLIENYRHILGREAPVTRLHATALSAFRRLVMNYLDLLRLPVLRKRVADLIEFEPSVLDGIMRQGNGAVIVTGHIGNWDLAGAFLAASGYPMSAPVEPIPGGWADTFNRYRRGTAMETIDMNDHTAVAAVLERRRVLAIVGDRDLTGRGIPCPAFDATRSYPRGPAAYSLRFGSPLLFGCAIFQDRPGARPYRAWVEPLEHSAIGDMDTDVRERTRAVARRLNELIADYPDQWFAFKAGWQ